VTLALALALFVAAQSADPQTADDDAARAADPDTEHSFSFAAVPTATFNTDEGFGTGGVGTLYHRYEGVEPYRDAITFNVFVSSKLVQAHAITWDAIKPFGIAGRLYLRARYYSTVSQNYCGVGNEVTCAPGEAAQNAQRYSLHEEATEELRRRYYLMRFIRPEAVALARPWLRDKPYRTELLLGWRGSTTIPGDLWQRGPYPGSRYREDFRVGEPGFSSAPILGLIVDNRDNEVFPLSGFYSETSVRGAHTFTGSTWSWVGGNAQLSAFFKMSRQPRVVLAQRLIADVILGEPSIEELARIGGTVDSIAFGGSSIGRGVREHRYLGKVKVISQTELRAQLFETELWGEVFNHGLALFSDVGWIGWDVADFRGDPTKLLGTLGISYRLLWNERFAIRWDLATSPNEAEGPGFYIIVGQVF
jgi:hypothetical protein